MQNIVNPSKILKDLRISNINRLVVAHLNINHIMGKLEPLLEIIQDNIDILAITETKLDESYATNMLDIEGYSLPYRRDRNVNGGGVLVYVKEGILCRELKTKLKTWRVFFAKLTSEKQNGYFLQVTTIASLTQETFYGVLDPP